MLWVAAGMGSIAPHRTLRSQPGSFAWPAVELLDIQFERYFGQVFLVCWEAEGDDAILAMQAQPPSCHHQALLSSGTSFAIIGAKLCHCDKIAINVAKLCHHSSL